LRYPLLNEGAYNFDPGPRLIEIELLRRFGNYKKQRFPRSYTSSYENI